MIIRTTGRKVTLKQDFLDLIEKRMRKFDKYFDDDAEANVTVTIENNRQTVEITLRSKGFLYRAERTDFDMEAAFSEAADLIDRQIVKNKSKLGARIKKIEQASASPQPPDTEEIVDSEYRVVREKRFALKPMLTEEAILQMNMLGHDFFVFLNADTGIINVVYKRRDDDYGLIIPE